MYLVFVFHSFLGYHYHISLIIILVSRNSSLVHISCISGRSIYIQDTQIPEDLEHEHLTFEH